MAGDALITVHDAMVTFGKKPLFDGLSFNIHAGDKISLVGKNGAGKTTLMSLITGTRELDAGRRWQMPGVTIGYLTQDANLAPKQTVFDYIFQGLKKERRTEEYEYMVYMVLEPLELDGSALAESLSGGQVRRAALARALVEEPDILLLDEPTNHLDLGAIEWLEEFLNSYRGTLLCVSHDKTFLKNISNKIFWLDRSRVRVCPKGFGYFDEWSQMLIEHEERELAKRQKLVAQEVEWASRGVKARRKRNVRRVAEMQEAREALKADKSSFRQMISKIELEPVKAAVASKVLVEFYKVYKNYDDKKILESFNMRIIKGERIGILGKNGSGKTSFLKLLTKEEEPDQGRVKLAHTAEISYFDQKRKDLNPQKSMWETLCPDGGDYLEVGGKMRHVCSYLKDFMFDPKAAHDLVGTLSGGQQNRLMLAKVLAKPGNVLILDEPTNDLDMDTLEMLEEMLSKYNGTLLVVSHDRDFLDQTVTKTLAFEGDAEVKGYIGGYSDYLVESGKGAMKPVKSNIPIKKETEKSVKKEEPKVQKLSFKEQHELEKLPDRISKLEAEIAELSKVMADPDLYLNDPEKFDSSSRRMARTQKELGEAELRWLELSEVE